MKNILVALLLILTVGCSSAFSATEGKPMNQFYDGSSLVSSRHYLVGYSGTTPFRYTIASLFGLYISTVTDGGICLGNSLGQIDCSSVSFTEAVIGGFVPLRAIESDVNGNLIYSLFDFTGTGASVKANTPTLVTPKLGVPTDTTFDANGSNNILKGYSYLQLSSRAFMRRGAGVLAPSTTQTDFNFGIPVFVNSTDEATNWIEWVVEVPADIDTAVALTARLSLYLAGADTADHDYVVSMCNPAASAAADCTVGNAVNLTFTADGSGADGDVEYTAETTLTDWAAGLTAGRMLKIRLARDGDDGTNDASTVNSYPLTLTLKYGYVN